MAESREAKITRGTSFRLRDDNRFGIRPSTVRRFGALRDALSAEVAVDREIRPIIWLVHVSGFVPDQIYRCFLQGDSRGKSLPVVLVKRFREKPPDFVVCLPLRSKNTLVAPAAVAPQEGRQIRGPDQAKGVAPRKYASLSIPSPLQPPLTVPVSTVDMSDRLRH